MEDQSLVDLFNRICADATQRERVVVRDYRGNVRREWTLVQLDDLTTRLAKRFLTRFNARSGACIAIYMNKCAEYVFSYIAALRAGCAYLPLDISYPEPLLNSVLDEVTPAVICTTSEHAVNLPVGSNLFIFDQEGNWLSELNQTDTTDVKLPERIRADDLAYIVYSSGTTGKPKGIACPHRGAVISYKFRFENYPYQKDDVVACNVFFVWELFRPILKGVTMVVIPDDVIYDPQRLCQFVKANNVTRMLFTPSLLEALFDAQKESKLQESFSTLRLIHLCGEVVTCELLNRFMKAFPHVKCLNLYSISETHDVAVSDLSAFYHRREERRYAPVGRVIPGVKVLIVDEAMKRVPIGVPGEIYVAGPTLALHYINRPELNKNRFVKVPDEYQREMGTRMYRTGDWGYLLANSVLEICGRCDTLVRIRGYGVELQAIESTLLKLKYVSSCAVVSIGSEGKDKQLAAYIVLREPISRKTLRADLKRRLPFYMVPQFFVFMERLPVLAASSKIDRKALPDVDFKSDIVEAEALPQTETEERLARLWAQVLQHSTLDIQESFFDLGGHSLLAARLLTKVNEEFRIELTMRDLFSAPTVHAMAALIDGTDRSSPEQNIDLNQQVETHDVKDNVMDLHLRAFWRSTEWKNRFLRANVLLTGVTGFLGSHILVHLMTNTQTQIVCLIRESSTEVQTMEQRVKCSLKKYGLFSKIIAEQFSSRVMMLRGDVALMQFGCSEEDYHFLTYDIDAVIHAAAYVNLIYPYQALHGINVLGTRNVIDFCLKNKIKPLNYISTDAVIPAGLQDVDEAFEPELVKEKLMDGYGQSKYVAEQLVLRSQSRGLPSIVYRLGNQGPSTTVGIWNQQDFTYLLIRAVLATGQSPGIDWMVELTPVDFTARFIAELAAGSFCQNVGKIFHLINTSSDAPKWSDVIGWLQRMGFKVQIIPFNDWRQTILSSEDPTLIQFQKLAEVMLSDESFFTTQTSFLRNNTDKLLASQLKRSYPRIDERLFKNWMRILVERQIISPPQLLPGSNALTGKVCIVTGASEGIGEAIARVLATDGGATVVLAARQVDKLEKLASKLCKVFGVANSNLHVVECDVTRSEHVERLVNTTLDRYARIDVLVNCAGCMYYCMVKNGYTDEWRRQIDVNCHGTTNMIGAVIPHMIKVRRGHILNITSDAGKKGFAGLAVYSGSKFFIEGISQGLRQELIEYGIRVTNVQPGDVATKLASRSTDNEAIAKYDFSKAGHKILEPEDVAHAVLYALSQPAHVAINEILVEPQAAPI